MTHHEETLIPLPMGRVPPVTAVRAQVLLTSTLVLRTHDLFDRYAANLAPADRSGIFALAAGGWAPAELAVAHYRACDALGLDDGRVTALSSEVAHVANRSTLSALARASRELGVTPWTALAMIEKLRAAQWRGGAFSVHKIGPKDARLEWHGQPCAASAYFRAGFAGVLTTMGGLFCERPWVRLIENRCTSSVASYRLAWA